MVGTRTLKLLRFTAAILTSELDAESEELTKPPHHLEPLQEPGVSTDAGFPYPAVSFAAPSPAKYAQEHAIMQLADIT